MRAREDFVNGLLDLARCRDLVGLAASLKNGIQGCQSPYLGRGIGTEVVANGNIPWRCPCAEPLGVDFRRDLTRDFH
jgi:hypothetical protein